MSWENEVHAILQAACQSAVMHCLEKAAPRPVKAREIAEFIYSGARWPEDPEICVRIHVHRLRKRLEGTRFSIVSGLGKRAGYRLIVNGAEHDRG
jgi:hypothetical protein